MEIIKKCNKRAIKFTCLHCNCSFKEEYVKCTALEREEFDDPFCDCGPLHWEDGKRNSAYFSRRMYFYAHCPECGHTCETSEKDYAKQCELAYEKEKELERLRKQKLAEDRRVEYWLEETRVRRKKLEREDNKILFEWTMFMIKLAEQEEKNASKVHYWNLLQNNIASYEKQHNIDFRKVENETDVNAIVLEIMWEQCDMAGVEFDFAINNRELTVPPSLDNTLYDPYLDVI